MNLAGIESIVFITFEGVGETESNIAYYTDNDTAVCNIKCRVATIRYEEGDAEWEAKVEEVDDMTVDHSIDGISDNASADKSK